ncbi:MAG TPA: phosphoribosylaminoimidazolesuccinocarboxamide synthase [Spirochaetia bacterium]|nr:phosphoribosylaminoimidazolesuccinocarboxamide synthase [Spirochaetia bacterium]
MEKAGLGARLERCLGGLDQKALPPDSRIRRGKVRDVVDLGAEMLMTTTDRISAFDSVLTTIPCKGEVLNTLSLFWFGVSSDIITNHIREEVSPRTVRVVRCTVVPIEVVVRGYLTGSAWRDYEAGSAVSGIPLPPGMRPSQKFDHPLITPSTKEEKGAHDRPVSREDILSSGRVDRKLWERIEETARALYQRGVEVAARAGLILVDTKYEFGLHGKDLVLVDELHTPDSSRYWYADTWKELFQAGKPQRELDKEYLRRWLLERGWKGDGRPPAIPDDVRLEVGWRYITAWQTITGTSFSPRAGGVAEESALVARTISSRRST